MKEKLPYVILHNSISIDGSLTNFDVNMELHYQLAANYKPDAHLIGSHTIKTGIQLYGGKNPVEEEKDFYKPKRDTNLPYWVIIDTQGTLHGILHVVRRFEMCKDVIVMISEKTPLEYIAYLKKRRYDIHTTGKNHVNLKKSLKLLHDQYCIKCILTDCGRILSTRLFHQHLIDEISLLIHPIIVGEKTYNIFKMITKKTQLTLKKTEVINNEYIWVVYTVKHH